MEFNYGYHFSAWARKKNENEKRSGWVSHWYLLEEYAINVRFLWLIAFLHFPLPSATHVSSFFSRSKLKCYYLSPPASTSQSRRRKKKSCSRFSRFAVPDLQCSLSKCDETTFEPSSSSSSFCLAGNGKVSNNSSKKIESFFLAHFLFHFVLPFLCTRSAFADESFFPPLSLSQAITI